jgi:hypothetical protein
MEDEWHMNGLLVGIEWENDRDITLWGHQTWGTSSFLVDF